MPLIGQKYLVKHCDWIINEDNTITNLVAVTTML